MTTAQAYFEDSYWYKRHVIDKHRRIIAEIIAACQESDIQSSHGEVGTDEDGKHLLTIKRIPCNA